MRCFLCNWSALQWPPKLLTEQFLSLYLMRKNCSRRGSNSRPWTHKDHALTNWATRACPPPLNFAALACPLISNSERRESWWLSIMKSAVLLMHVTGCTFVQATTWLPCDWKVLMSTIVIQFFNDHALWALLRSHPLIDTSSCSRDPYFWFRNAKNLNTSLDKTLMLLSWKLEECQCFQFPFWRQTC